MLMNGDWHASPHEPPAPSAVACTLAGSLAVVAEAFPVRCAVVDRGEAIGFSELALRVGGLAGQIAEAGAGPGPVGLLLSAGVDFVAAWFACALAGRPFVLLEEGNPPERNRSLLVRSQAAILLHDRDIPSSMSDGFPGLLLLRPEGRRARFISTMGLAHDAPSMFFPTSGSSGEPKLVVYSAHTLQSKVQASICLMGPFAGDAVVIAGAHGNYGFIHHALVFLLSGRGVCMVDVRECGLAGIFAAIEDHGATNARFTPSLFRVAAAMPSARPALEKLRAVRFSGEPLLAADLLLARAILHRDCRIQNVYGSTESSLFIWQDDRASALPGDAVPIGQIYPGSEIRIVDGEGMTVPDGGVGELVIRSANHALGDWENGALDLRRFPGDPQGSGLRCYHTGDMVRRLPGGELVPVGRKDRLLKINGRRFSLDELESHLLHLPGCAQATVVEGPVRRGNRLVAFLVPAGDNADRTDPRVWLAGRVPSFAIPARFEWIERMPLLPGGKVDHQALRAGLPPAAAGPHREDVGEGGFSQLRDIWMAVLDLPDAALDADFPSLGGDSLQFLELSHQVRQRFGKAIVIEAFQTRPTLRGLAHHLGIPLPGGDPVIAIAGGMHVRFQLIHRASGPRRGIALGMPGLNGASSSARFVEAGIFHAFDVWDCTLGELQGDLLEGRRWVDAARRIAALLRDGSGPRADLLFGYSLAGYIAWLVDRALDQSPCRPGRVVCLDTLPMHRSWKHRTVKHRELLSSRIAPAGGFLQINRQQPADFRFGYGQAPSRTWHASDGPAIRAELSTYDHDDPIKPHVLRRVAGLINRFAEEGVAAMDPRPRIDGIDTPAGRVFDMLCGNRNVSADLLSGILREFDGRNSVNAFVILQYLTLAHGHWSDAIGLLDSFVSLHPQKHAPRYALLRLRRMAPCPPARTGASRSAGRPLPLQSFASVERALAIRLGRARPGWIDALIHLPDRLSALAASLPAMLALKGKEFNLKTRLMRKKR